MKRWRYRPVQAVTVAALAALMAACAGFAPLYYRAIQQALTSTGIADASVLTTSVQLTVAPGEDFSLRRSLVPPESVAGRMPVGLRGDFHRPVLGYAANSGATVGGVKTIGDLSWHLDQCDHLEITSGRCPERAGEIAVSRADVENFGLEVGSTTEVAGAAGASGDGRPVELRIVGTYRQDPSDYWLGQSLTGHSGVPDPESQSAVQHDSWVSPRATFEDDAHPVDTVASTATYLLDADRVGVDELLELGPAVDALATGVPPPGQPAVAVVSGLDGLAAGVQHQIDQSRVTVPLLMAQLCVLAVVVLWLVLLAITEQRRPEVALARLRGRSRRGSRGLLLAELLPMTLLAVVPGGVLAVLAAWGAARLLLPAGVPLELRWPFVAALALAAVVLSGVTVLAARRVAREPVDRLLRRVPPRRARWALGTAEAVVVAAAGAVTVLFATGGLDGPAALAAPGLLGIVVGIVLAHLTTPTAAALGRRLLRGGRVRAGTSMLDAARSPATRRVIAIVTVASALAVFSADALVIGQRNRASAAQQEIGAPMVATVQGGDLAAVRAALADVDPSGTRATPVVRVRPPGDGAASTLGVVPDQFPRIALFGGDAPDTEEWAKLSPPSVDPIEITGDELRGVLDDATLSSVLAQGGHTPVTVGLDLLTASGDTLRTTLAEVRPGQRRVRVHHWISCQQGCVLAGVWFRTFPAASLSGSVTLRDLAALPSGEPVGIGPARQWAAYRRAGSGAVLPSSSSPDRLTVKVVGRGASELTLAHRWLPTTVDALVAGPLPPGSNGDHFTLSGLDGTSQAAVRVGTLASVPGSPPHTFVADLDTLQRGRDVLATDELSIWFDRADPGLLATTTRALADHGVAVADTATLAGVRRGFDDSAATWSLQLAALVGLVAILIELLALVVSAASGWRTRARDLAALRMTGVGGRAIRTMAVAAQAPAVLVGVLAGALSGLAGAVLAMPMVPLFATEPDVSTLDLHTAWWVVLAAVVGSLVVLVAGSLSIGWALADRARLPRLRETL